MRVLGNGFLAVLGLGVFLLNPAGCEPDFEYDERELRAAVEGTWELKLQPASGAPSSFTFRLEQGSAVAWATPDRGGPVAAAIACGNRTLVKSAGACISSTSMPLQGQILEGSDTAGTASVRGSLEVPGRIFSQGILGLTVGPHAIQAVLSSAGQASSVRTRIEGETATLSRIAPAAP